MNIKTFFKIASIICFIVAFIFLPFVFLIDFIVIIHFLFVLFLGIIFATVPYKIEKKEELILKNGKKFRGKIYAYSKDYSMRFNGQGILVVEFRYFDETGTEQNAFFNTGIVDETQYPLGKSITGLVYNGKCILDKNSIDNDELYAQELLMDDKPLGAHVHLVATQCKNCGASLYEAEGFIYKCPYCSSYGNLKFKAGTLEHFNFTKNN